MKLTLIRHGTTAWNEQARYQGWTDLPLAEAGITEAQALADCMARDPIDAVITSDLKRCVETARIVFPMHVTRPTPELRELSFGEWEGLTYQECLDRYPDVYSQWLDDAHSVIPPGGESVSSFHTRIRNAFDVILTEYAEDTNGHIAIVTHGGPIRYAVELLLERHTGRDMPDRVTPGTSTPIAPGGYIQFSVSSANIAIIEQHNHFDRIT